MYCRHPYVENPQGLSERTNEAAGEYARACIAVAGECGIPVVDLWNKMQHRKKDYLRSEKSCTFLHSCDYMFDLVLVIEM